MKGLLCGLRLGATLQRSALPYVHNHLVRPSYEGGLCRALQTDLELVQRPPRTLRIEMGTTWSETLKLWFVSMVGRNDYDNIVYAKLRGYESQVPLTKNSLVKSFDSASYALLQAASTARHDMELSAYGRIDFITKSKDVVENINALQIQNEFLLSQNLILMAREKLEGLLQEREVHVCWNEGDNRILANEFGERVKLASERHYIIGKHTVDNFVGELKEGIVYDNDTIQELANDL